MAGWPRKNLELCFVFLRVMVVGVCVLCVAGERLDETDCLFLFGGGSGRQQKAKISHLECRIIIVRRHRHEKGKVVGGSVDC